MHQLLRDTLEAYFEVFKPTNFIKGTRSDAEVLRLLQAKGHQRFRSSATGRERQIKAANIPDLIEEALQTYPVKLFQPFSSDEFDFTAFDRRLQTFRKKLRLKELRVVPPLASAKNGATTIGSEAARLFEHLISEHLSQKSLIDSRNGNPLKIGIGGGRTMHKMTIHLQPQDRKVTLVPLNYATSYPAEGMFDSINLTTHIHWLYNGSKTGGLGIPPLPRNQPERAASWHSDLFKLNSDIGKNFADGLSADIIFLGASNFHENAPSINRIYSHLGVDHDALSKMKRPPVGDINLCLFDAIGGDITPDILTGPLRNSLPPEVVQFGSFFPNEKDCHPFLVGLNIAALRSLIRDNKTVVLVADSHAKLEAIFTCVRYGVVNGLVTDAATFDLLEKRAAEMN